MLATDRPQKNQSRRPQKMIRRRNLQSEDLWAVHIFVMSKSGSIEE